jgi:hypothetical protein
MKFIRCAVHTADTGNSGKNLQVGCVHGDIQTLGVRRKLTLPREPLCGLQARVDCQLCNLVKSPSETSANRNKCNIILSRDNGITKFRFSVCSASPHMHPRQLGRFQDKADIQIYEYTP